MSNNIERTSVCFCCGTANEKGLHLEFRYPEPGMAEADFDVPAYFAGWKGIAHGGFVSMLLDELMSHAILSFASPEGQVSLQWAPYAVTAEMTIRFKKSVPVESKIKIVGKVEEVRGRMLKAKSWIYLADNEIAAQGQGTFLRMG